MQTVLVLSFRNSHTVSHAWKGRPLSVGLDPYCDLVLSGKDVPDRGWLIDAKAGALRLRNLVTRRSRWLRLNQPVPLTEDFTLTRQKANVREGWTENLGRNDPEHQPLEVMVYGQSRRPTLLREPLVLGSGSESDIVIHDRTVSRRHVSVEPIPGGALVRDLGSSNGTHIQGRRVHCVEVRGGATLHLGRSTVYLRPRRPPALLPECRSSTMRALLHEIGEVAANPFPVLIHGETGAGKGWVASQLHRLSAAAHGPWVQVNVGEVAESLAQSQFFGHEAGAFTGANRSHRGFFERAHGGTLFLDEIGELPARLQVMLLRVLESNEVLRVGSESSTAFRTRLIAGTHRNLKQMVREGTFRQDLYYRLRHQVLHVPPLRERKEDIVPLAEHFLRLRSEELGARMLTPCAKQLLQAHPWPGNVRELQGVITSAASRSGSEVDAQAIGRVLDPADPDEPVDLLLLLESHQGNVTAAARAAGLARSTFRDRLRRLELGKGNSGGT